MLLLPLSGIVEVNCTDPEQVASLGPKRLKMTEPVGELPPATVAVSEIVPPTVVGPVAWVVMLGLALVTFELSLAAPQALVIGLLLASPL